MKIIPTLKCHNMRVSLAFYTGIIGFRVKFMDSSEMFCQLFLEDQELHLSTHSGDGVFGTAVYIQVEEVDELFKTFIAKGLDTSKKKMSPVHQSPLDQTWGMREFYVDDPDGNTLRFGRPIE